MTNSAFANTFLRRPYKHGGGSRIDRVVDNGSRDGRGGRTDHPPVGPGLTKQRMAVQGPAPSAQLSSLGTPLPVQAERCWRLPQDSWWQNARHSLRLAAPGGHIARSALSARRTPGTPQPAITGQDGEAEDEEVEGAQAFVKATTCEDLSIPVTGAPGRTRTCNLRLRRPLHPGRNP